MKILKIPILLVAASGLLASCSELKVTGMRYPVAESGYVQYMAHKEHGALFTIHVTNAPLHELMGALKTTYSSAAAPELAIVGTDTNIVDMPCSLDLADVPASGILHRISQELGISIEIQGHVMTAKKNHNKTVQTTK